MNATPIKDSMVPIQVITDKNDGKQWLVFSYDLDDRPWKWPKAIRYDGRVFVWMSWDSDKVKVYYKETSVNEIAYPVKGKAR